MNLLQAVARILGPVVGKQLTPLTPLTPVVGDRGTWWHRIISNEPFTGAWQRNVEVRTETVLTYSAVFACVTLIASDIGKLRIKLMQKDADGIWEETESSAFSPVLDRPNRYQNRIKFLENWVLSKLIYGNAYILKQRDNRGVVTALYVLDPNRVQLLQAPNGDLFYELKRDDLVGIRESPDRPGAIVVPETEIIHDPMAILYHSLIGVSPITACGISAIQGLNIQNNSARFFKNSARPSGILTAPGHIGDDTATRLKTYWDNEFTEDNIGRVAVLGDDLHFESMTMTAVDAQLIEQLKMTAEQVCTAFHVPSYMIGVGPPPNYNNIEALSQQYYGQCLQSLIEQIELNLDEGLGLKKVPGKIYGAELDLEGLLRMDTATLYDTISKGINGGFLAINEGRKRLDLKPKKGGESPVLQQQYWPLEVLAERQTPPAPGQTPSTTPTSSPGNMQDEDEAVAAITVQSGWSLKSYLAAA